MQNRLRLVSLIVLVALPIVTASAQTATRPAGEGPPLRVLMIVGGGHHDYDALPAKLMARLTADGRIDGRILADLGGLSAEMQKGCDVLIFNNCQEAGLSEPQRKSLLAAVHGGTGLVAVHCALWSFQSWPEWRRMLGGLVSGHDPFGEYPVAVVDRSHPIAEGLPAEFTVTDEPYLVDERDPSIHTIAQTAGLHGGRPAPEPQAWTTRYSGGRVFVTTLGHDARVQENPAFVTLLRNGILWSGRRLGPPTTASELERREGFRPLFDGKTLAGWRYHPDYWSVRDGILTGKSPAGLLKNSYAIFEKPFADFILRFSVKLEGASNSGVQFRSQELPEFEVAGYQADVVLKGWGNLHEQNGRARLVDGWTGKSEHAVNPDDWVDMEVEARGPRIVIRTNGMVTADYTEQDPSRPRQGIIALQLHRGEPTIVHFTNIRLKPLGGSAAE